MARIHLGAVGQPVGLEATGAAVAKKGVGDLARNLAFDRVPGVFRRNNGLNEGFDFGGILRQGPASYRVNGSRIGAVGRGVLRARLLALSGTRPRRPLRVSAVCGVLGGGIPGGLPPPLSLLLSFTTILPAIGRLSSLYKRYRHFEECRS
ncbi:MAG TPA: hypothetical protein VFF07_00780 [Actinomycetota bacterium]|nr:hypothetical protein [Actinomycetota bacterium]